MNKEVAGHSQHRDAGECSSGLGKVVEFVGNKFHRIGTPCGVFPLCDSRDGAIADLSFRDVEVN
jgi:hypothetical protein